MALEDDLQDAADRGLTHFSVYPVHSADRKTVYWHATASPSTASPPSKYSGTNIAEVVARALQGMARGKKFAASSAEQTELPEIRSMEFRHGEDDTPTAAVTGGFEDFLPKP